MPRNNKFVSRRTFFTVFFLALCVFAICLFSGKAHAKEWNLYTGNGLLSVCSSEDLTEEVMCVSYIEGFLRGVSLQKVLTERILKSTEPELLALDPHLFEPFCIPKRTVTRTQMRLIIKKYLLEHPIDLHANSDFLIILALSEAFPCH